MDGKPEDDEKDRADGDRSAGASRLSPSEFVREARRRRGLDPSRLSDLPDEDADDEVSPDPRDGGGQEGSGPGGDRSAGGAVPVDRPALVGDSDPAVTTDTTDTTDTADDTDATDSSADTSDGSADASDGTDGAERSSVDDQGTGRVTGSSVPCRWSLGSVRSGPLESGAGGLVEALAGLETPGDLDDGCLAERTVDLLRARSLLDAAIASHAREWDSRCLWATDQSKSPSARLARDANVSRATATGVVRFARALARMPRTWAALADGRISVDHARRLIDACSDERLELFTRDETRLIDEAVRLGGHFNDFCRVIRHWEHAADDELSDPTDPHAEPPGAKRQRRQRDFQMPTSPEGFDIRGSLPTADGLIVWTQLQRIYDDLWATDWAAARTEHGDAACEALLCRTVAQRRADALVEMARRASAYRCGDTVARPLVTVLVHAEDLFGPLRETSTAPCCPGEMWLNG